MPSTIEGSTEDSKYLALSVETQTLPCNSTPNGKNVFRVVLVNERGERVLDTLVAPQVKNVSVKGARLALLKYAELKAESYECVKGRLLKLISGKHLVGYLLQ